MLHFWPFCFLVILFGVWGKDKHVIGLSVCAVDFHEVSMWRADGVIWCESEGLRMEEPMV